MSSSQGANQIVQNAVKRMQKEGAERLNAQVDNWLGRTSKAMNVLLSYQAMENTTLGTSAMAAREQWVRQGCYNPAVMQMEIQKREIAYKAQIEQAYRLLNEIGEKVRGAEITYSLVLNTPDGSGHMEWSGLNINQFLSVTDIIAGSSGKMVLKKTDTVINKLTAMNDENIAYQKWSKQKEAAYEHFQDVVKKRGTWKDLNEGQMLEAFSKYYRRKNKNDNMILDTMKDTLSAPEAFWQDGDDQIGSGSSKRVIQYKSNDASVTTVNTLVAKLEKVYSGLQAIKGQVYEHAAYPSNQAAVGQVEQKMNTALEKFVVQFLKNDVLKALKV